MVPALVAAVLVSNVLVVDPATPGSYPDIQPAINAAVDGDTILVKSGSYSGFSIDDKSLSLVVDLSNNALVQGAVHVDNLSPGKYVSLSGFTIQAPGTYALFATNDSGGLRLQDCNIHGADGATALPGTGAVRLDNADDVAFADCQLQGGRGGLGISAPTGGAGGVALSSADSQVALYDCTLGGGDGGNGVLAWGGGSVGGTGGRGCALQNGTFFASNCLVTGGHGGHGGDGSDSCLGSAPADGGAGGDGIRAIAVPPSSAALLLMACSVAGGAGGAPGQPSGGSDCWDPTFPGANGVAIVAPAGAVQMLAGSARVFNAPRVTRELQLVPIAFHGQPGDAVWVLFASNPDFTPDIPFHGVRLTESSARLVGFGTIGASGTLNTQFILPDYGPVAPGKTFFLQGLFRDTSNQRFLAAAPVLVELDSTY